MYITADSHLAEEVRREAEALGLKAAADPDDEQFLAGEAILVVSMAVLINGKTRFGLSGVGGRRPIFVGSVVIDDAHAAVAELEARSTLKVPRAHQAYPKVAGLFEDDLKGQGQSTWRDIMDGDRSAVLRIPFWAWQNRQAQVMDILHAHRKEAVLEWEWPLVDDELHLCQAVVTADAIEIKPPCPPIQKFPSFAEAQRRIYLTATLAEDSILVTHFDADPTSIADPVVPKSAADLGDRLIVAPMSLNPGITDAEVRGMAAELARTHNVVVLVPSHAREGEWNDVAAATASTMAEISALVRQLKAGHVGLAVIVNRYDGIDLPGDACRVLVIDGVPEAYTGIERREAAALRQSRAMTTRQMQRVEQGMGRGVRSRDDRCAVVILGASLTRLIAQADVAMLLSPATRAQMVMSRTVAADMKGAGTAEIVSVIEQVVSGDPKFREASRGALKGVVYGPATVDPAATHLRQAYNAAVRGLHADAVEHASAAVRAVKDAGDLRYAGWLTETWADYTHAVDQHEAQRVLAGGRENNPAILRPLAGVGYVRIKAAEAQAEAARDYLASKYSNAAELILGGQAVLDDLTWHPGLTREAEAAIAELGRHLGITTQMPEEEGQGVGPDALWALGNHSYAVIEAKTGSQADLVHKKDINQLAGSVNWCQERYGADATAIPVLVHRKTTVERTGTPPDGTRVVTAVCLKALKDAVGAYLLALGDDFRDPGKIAAQLAFHGLRAEEIFRPSSPYSVPAQIQR